jgi:hypothetical protein
MRLIQTIIFALGLFIAGSASATEYYWAVSTPGNWNDPNNWAATSGGAGGFGVPSTLADRAHFDANGQGDCLVDGAITVRGIDTEPAYTGTITQSAGQLLHIGNQGFILDGGSFIGSDATIDLDGSIATAVGTQFTATSGLFDVGAGALFTMYGDFDHNGGTLLFYGGRDINTAVGGTALNNVTVETAGSFTRLYVRGSGHLIVDGDWNFTGASPTEVNLGIVEMRGNLTADMTNLRGGSAVWRFTGTADQTITGHLTDPGIYGFIGAVEIDKPSGTFFTTGIVGFNRALRYYKGAVAFGTGAANKCIIYQSTTLEGNMTFSHLEYRASLGIATVAALPSTTITCTNEFTFGGTFQLVTTGGDIDMLGDIVMNNPALSPQSTRLNIIGTTDQTITGLPSEPTSQGFLGFMTIKKASGTLFLNGHIGFAHHFNYDEGNVVAGTGIDDEVYLFSSTQSQFNGNLTLNDVTFKSENVYSYGVTLGSTLTVNGDLTFADALSMQITQAGTVDVKGDIYVNNDLLNGGAATIKLSGSTDQTVHSVVTPFRGFLPNLTIDKPAGDVLLVNALSFKGILTFVSGNIISSTSSPVVLAGSWHGASASSHVDGPVKSSLLGTVIFPIGNAGQYRPMTVSGGFKGQVFTAEYVAANQPFGSSTPFGLTISNCEYWTMSTTGSSALTVELGWGAGSCNIAADLNDMRVAHWSGTAWENLGNGGTTGDVNTGTVTSSITTASPIVFTLGNVAVQDPNTTSWIGGTNTDFFNASNWNNGKPSGTMNVVIGDHNFTGPHQPELKKKSATILSLHLGQGTSTNTFSLGSKTLKVKGDIAIGPNGVLSADKTIKIEGSWLNNGTFFPGTSKVVFEKATSPQMIYSTTFYSLHLKGTAEEISLGGDIVTNNELKLISGTFNAGAYTITANGRWFDIPQGFVPETSTVIFTGASGAVPARKIPTESFYNLVIEAPGLTMESDVDATLTIAGHFHVNAGTFVHDVGTGTLNGNTAGNCFVVADNATLKILSANFEDKYVGFESVLFAPNSTVVYGGSVPQNIALYDYGQLSFDGGSTKTTLGETNVLGNLTNLGGATDNLALLAGSVFRVLGDLNMGPATITADAGLFRLDGDWNSGLYTSVNKAQVGFAGSGLQNINQTGLSIPKVILQNTGDGLKLNALLNITEEFRFVVGLVETDATNLLVFEDGAVVTNVSNGSFVNGPVGKVGDDLFTFPTGAVVTVGGEGFYAPVTISAPSGVTSSLVAEYRFEAQAFGTALGAGLESVGDCDYWTLESKTSAESVELQLWWDNTVCSVDPADAQTVYWDNTEWKILEQIFIGTEAAGSRGTLRAGPSTIPFNLPFHFGFGTSKKSIPMYGTLKKIPDGGYYQVPNGILRVQHDEEYNDQDGEMTFNIYNSFRQIVVSDLSQTKVLHYGDNRHEIDLSCNEIGLNRGYYLLEIVNEKNESVFIRFYQAKNFVCADFGPQ